MKELKYIKPLDIHAIEISKVLIVNKTLTKLDLYVGSIEGAGKKALSEALLINKHLLEIDLFENFNLCKEALLKALQLNTSIIKIGLKYFDISPCISFLPAVIRPSKPLRELNLSNNNISDEG